MSSSVPHGDRHHIAENCTENSGERLTRIRQAYTLASTPESGGEIDKLMIDNFLTTLAGIAMSIASRNLQGEKEGGI